MDLCPSGNAGENLVAAGETVPVRTPVARIGDPGATAAGGGAPAPAAATEGWRATAVDLTIVAARPRLGRWLDPMRGAIADLLGLDQAVVNVKASSGNLDGAEGAGRSISALVLATIEST